MIDDGRIYMRSVRGNIDVREVTQPLKVTFRDGSYEFIQPFYEWNGASSGIFRPFFPKWKHPLATCKHDFRCERATCKEDRLFADTEFKKDIERLEIDEKPKGAKSKVKLFFKKAGLKKDSILGYYGVRIGAFFGIGSNF